LANNLKRLPDDKAVRLSEHPDIAPEARPQEVSPGQYLKLFRQIHENKN